MLSFVHLAGSRPCSYTGSTQGIHGRGPDGFPVDLATQDRTHDGSQNAVTLTFRRSPDCLASKGTETLACQWQLEFCDASRRGIASVHEERKLREARWLACDV